LSTHFRRDKKDDQPLNIDLEVNNERQDCNIGIVSGEILVGGGMMNKGD
jgi:hypothetical protein